MSATGPRMKRLGASGRRGEEDSGVWSFGGFFFETIIESRGTDQSSRALPPWVGSANMGCLGKDCLAVSVLFFFRSFSVPSPLSLRSPTSDRKWG